MSPADRGEGPRRRGPTPALRRHGGFRRARRHGRRRSGTGIVGAGGPRFRFSDRFRCSLCAKVRQTKKYTADMIDWLAVYEATTDRCFYVPASQLGEGMQCITLRLRPAKNNQVRGLRHARHYESI